MFLRKVLVLGIVFGAFSFSVYPQSTIKSRKIEIGCHATYFFDDRGFQFEEINHHFPFGIIRSYAFSTTRNDFQSGFQYRLTAYNTVSREHEYYKKKIVNKSFREIYTYSTVLYTKSLKEYSFSKSFSLIGLTYRYSAEEFFANTLPDVFYDEKISHDISLSFGLRYEVNLSKNIYVYIQPLYNFYFFRTNKDFLRNEIIGNFGLGYRFNSKIKKK